MARPSKLTPLVQGRICRYVAEGLSYADAALLAGVSETTYHRWRQKGQAARSGKFREFWQRIQAATAISRRRALETIERAARGHTRHKPWTRTKTEIEKILDEKGNDTGLRKAKTVTEQIGADWRAALALLERRDPKFVPRRHIEHSGKVQTEETGAGPPPRRVEIVFVDPNPEEDAPEEEPEADGSDAEAD